MSVPAPSVQVQLQVSEVGRERGGGGASKRAVGGGRDGWRRKEWQLREGMRWEWEAGSGVSE